METVRVQWDHDAGWTKEEFGCDGPWKVIPKKLWDEYQSYKELVWELECEIRNHQGA